MSDSAAIIGEHCLAQIVPFVSVKMPKKRYGPHRSVATAPHLVKRRGAASRGSNTRSRLAECPFSVRARKHQEDVLEGDRAFPHQARVPVFEGDDRRREALAGATVKDKGQLVPEDCVHRLWRCRWCLSMAVCTRYREWANTRAQFPNDFVIGAAQTDRHAISGYA